MRCAICKAIRYDFTPSQVLTDTRDQLIRWVDGSGGMWGYYWWQGASMLSAVNDLALLDENVMSTTTFRMMCTKCASKQAK